MNINKQKDILFAQLISEFPSEKQATLNLMYKHACAADEDNRRREMEQLKKEIVKEVLALIMIEISSGDALKGVDIIGEALGRIIKISQ